MRLARCAEFHGLVAHLWRTPAGRTGRLIGSSGNLVIAEVNGSAAGRLNAAWAMRWK